MKKIIAILTIVLILCCFAGCGSKTTDADAQQSDLEYVQGKGKLIVGITDFKPMDYQEKDGGEWIGFDADMAKAFAESLGVEVEFIEITWDNKIFELDGKTIDCVWNGMTLTDDVKSAMSTSNAYLINSQVVVVKTEVADKYKTAEDCKDLKFAVENGSAGKDMAVENGFNYTEVETQSTALMEVASGTSDAAIIDSLMAGAMIGEGTGYESLTYTVGLNSEEYGVGFRKGSDLTERLNAFFKEYTENGKMEEMAKKYGVQEALIK